MNSLQAKLIETFDLERLGAGLSETIFSGRLHYLPETPSTNELAMEAANRGEPEGTLFLADKQTSGKGRGGHSWHSEPNASLLFSFILRPNMAAENALWLSLLSGLAIFEGVKSHTGTVPDLRWPNDLLLSGKKFCGILTELATDGNRVRHTVIGIGVNVNQSAFPRDLTAIATSIKTESGREWARCELLIALLKSIDTEYKAAMRDFASNADSIRVRERLQAVSSYVKDKSVYVAEAGGYEGITAGLDERGFLLVRTATGIRRVISGGVRELR